MEHRCLTIDASGKWLAVANQRSNGVTVFPRDTKTGLPGPPASGVKIAGACFVLWA